jgi:hypothetical protein
MEFITSLKEKRDKHWTNYKVAFASFLILLFIVSIFTLVTGAAVIRLEIFEHNHIDSLMWFKRKILAGLIIYFIIVLQFTAFGIILIKYPPRCNNIVTLVFGILAFFIGFLPMMISGTSLIDFTKITNAEMNYECGLDENGNRWQPPQADE